MFTSRPYWGIRSLIYLTGVQWTALELLLEPAQQGQVCDDRSGPALPHVDFWR